MPTGEAQQIAALSRAVRLPVVAKYLAQVGLALAALTAVPLAAALLAGDWGLAGRDAAVIALLLGGIPLARRRPPEHVQPNEAMAVTALSFVLAPLLMAFPLMVAGLSFLDAWFEAVSAVTTTGLTTISSVAAKSHGFLFTRAWMQWYGGLGIAVLSVALIVRHHVAAKLLVNPGQGESFASTAQTHARRVFAVYAAITVAGVALVWAVQGNGFVALVHVLGAVSTGGFSSFDNSLAGLVGWPSRFAILLVSFLGAVSLPTYFRAYRNGWRALPDDRQLRALAVLSAIVIALLALSMHQYLPWRRALPEAALLGLSAQTTTGFSALPVAHLSAMTKGIVILSMLIGGGLGSTAGGIKLLRLLVVIKLASLLVRRSSVPPHAVVEPRLGRERLEGDDIIHALLLVVLFMVLVLLSWLPFLAAGFDPLNALFEVASAVATVGLSAGITGAHLAPGLKIVLCLDMLFGRLEIIALLVLLYPGTWLGRRHSEQ